MRPGLSALLQLASPTLPVGAYSYSQGLESAIESGLVHDEDSARRWIADGLQHLLARDEAPVWLRLHAALEAGDDAALRRWNEEFIATRETRELRAETVQMGYSLLQLLRTLGHAPPACLADTEVAYPAAHAWACRCWDIDADDGLAALLYGWAENQVMAALKTVPLGQSAGQRLLCALREPLAAAAQAARDCPDAALNTQAPLLGILSAQHETQYSRLFRS